MRLNLRQVEAFRAVMVAGGITKAATMLHVTQPAVSRLIADFELAIGFKLFDRSRRQLVPTDECHTLFGEVQRTFAGLDHIARTADAIRQMQRGHLSVVAMPIISTSFLPHVIARFAELHPDISVSLWTWPRDQALDWIVSQQYDLGLLTLPINDPAVKVEALPSADAVCLIPENHELAQRDTIAPADLADVNFVSLTTGSRFRHDLDGIFEREGVARTLRVEARSAAAIVSLVQCGVGVSILSPMAIYGGQVKRVVVRPFLPATPVSLGLVYQAQRPLSLLARRFADLVLEMAREPAPTIT